ncbi:Uncharacterized conserved protein YjbJ, UPF0337 family [Arboricoccus pini]|uniref:Uncharacterized conserved protein YjbJ, UPF0337 family n=1 Tax=Arboricoccus pini TaxID=1963835 RepID=A0A212R7M0_9PROT|nr:CsbD family protein [Arboricoccus pini]SNB68088.1 Uncharacterized conserved protein YjbJ, UPF0337 family [Arboricoccus pini]
MDRNRVEGTAKDVKGKINEAVGKLTGNDRLRAEGKTDQVAGKAQGALGKSKDAVKAAVKH